ncbi:flagellin [Clostridium acetobutylicum]|nr:flagellin [Clostridium acetobutylicum]
MDINLVCQGGQPLENTPVDSKNIKTQKIEIDAVKNVENIEIKNEKETKNTGKDIDKLLKKDNTHVEYSVHKVFGDLIIKIVDNDTKKVVEEIPPEKILDMVAKLCQADGVLLDKRV